MPQAKRKAAKVDSQELLKVFNKKIGDFGRYALQDIDKIGTDIKKVNFDFENCDYGPVPEFGNELVGLRKMYVSGGYLNFIGVTAGGDWEYPVFFIIYLDQDGKTLRGYIPKEGNVWNQKTKQAFGNDEEADSEFLKNWFKKNEPDAYKDALAGWDEEEDGPFCMDVDCFAEAMHNTRKIATDIYQRIEVV